MILPPSLRLNSRSPQVRGLIHLWSMTHAAGQGGALTDLVGGVRANNNWSGAGNSWRGYDARRMSISLNGSSYWKLPDTNRYSLINDDEFTISTWFRSLSGSWGCLYGEGRDSNNNPLLVNNINVVSAGRIEFAIRDEFTQIVQVYDSGDVLSGKLNDGGRHLFTATRRGKTISVYIDGIFFGSDTNNSLSTSIFINGITLGAIQRVNLERVMQDEIAQMAIYERELTPPEIYDLWQNPLDIFTPVIPLYDIAAENQTDVTLSPAPADAIADTPAPTVDLAGGAITLTPAPADAIADIVAPTVSLVADVTLSPPPADAVADAIERFYPTFRVYIDWSNDADFDDPRDDITDDVISANWRNGFTSPYQDIADEAYATIKLRNTDGKYTPENTNSPLFGLMKPNRRVRITSETPTGEALILFTGFVRFPSVNWRAGKGAYTGQDEATIQATGSKFILERAPANIGLYTNVTADEIIRDIVRDVQLPPSETSVWQMGIAGKSELGTTSILGNETDFSLVETGETVFPFYGDSVDMSAYDALQELTQAERGRLFFDRQGRVVWWNRHHMLLDTTDRFTVVTTSGPYKPRDVRYTFGEFIVNNFEIRSSPRTTGTSQSLWELESPITIQANDRVTFEAELRRDNGQFAGAGTITPNATFASGSANVTATARGGKAAIEIQNTASTKAILDSLTLTGAPITQQNSLSVTRRDEASIGEHGFQSQSISVGPLNDYDMAENIALFELRRRARARGVVTEFGYRRKWDGVDNRHIFAWEIGTRVKIVADEIGHTDSYFIVGESHTFKPGAKGASGVHDVSFYLEPAPEEYWILGVSALGENTTLSY